MTKNNSPLLIIVLVVVIANIAILLFIVNRRSVITTTPVVQQTSLALTHPVYSLEGKVLSVGSNRFTIQMTSLPVNPGESDLKLPEFTITTNDKTFFNKAPSTIPYQLQRVNPGFSGSPIVRGSFQDIREGIKVRISTDKDVRFEKNSSVVATSVDIIPEVFQISGEVSEVTAGNLQVRALLPNTVPNPKMTEALKIFNVNVISSTEISAVPSVSTTAAELVPYTAIKKGSIVSIYSQENPETTTNLTALLINPILLNPPARVIQPASPSATISVQITIPVATNSPSIQVR